MILFWILAGIATAVLLIAYICFRVAFYAPVKPSDDIPAGPVYDPYRSVMEQWARETRALPHENMTVTSFDGLTLTGKFYEYAPGAPVELMFHGYRGTAERDLSGGVERCFRLGRSALIVDQRTSGGSEGKVITFGIREHRDCLTWLDFAVRHSGPDVKIILAGISMGATTVLMCADQKLPENVIGILADCGFTSAKDIIMEVIGQMGLPPKLSYPFVKLGAKLFGGFDLEEKSALEAVRHATVPVIFFHGEADDYVPCSMSRENFDACTSRKKLVTIPGAGHGLSYPAAPEIYMKELREFFGEEASWQG